MEAARVVRARPATELFASLRQSQESSDQGRRRVWRKYQAECRRSRRVTTRIRLVADDEMSSARAYARMIHPCSLSILSHRQKINLRPARNFSCAQLRH